MKTNVVVAVICVILAVAGVFFIPGYITSHTTADIELDMKWLWIGYWAGAYFAVRFLVSKLRLRKEAQPKTKIALNTGQIAEDVIADIETRDRAAYRLFIIAQTPDEHSKPDALVYHAWLSKFFDVNDGPSSVLGKLRKGTWPILPHLERSTPPPLTPRQRTALAQLFRELKFRHAVR
jgi:hypothetical protein